MIFRGSALEAKPLARTSQGSSYSCPSYFSSYSQLQPPSPFKYTLYLFLDNHAKLNPTSIITSSFVENQTPYLVQYLMAQSTISVKPFPKHLNQEHLRAAFKEFALKRLHINRANAEAFVEFESPNDVEALSISYEDCKVPALDNAEIGFVQVGFQWPAEGSSPEEEGLIEIVELNKDALISIKNCNRLEELSEQQILNIFKKYAISKLARFNEDKEIIIEFQQAGDLETLEIDFEDYKVPALGRHALIDVQSPIDTHRFIQQYRLQQKKIESIKNQEEKSASRFEAKMKEAQTQEQKQELEREQARREEEELAQRARALKQEMEAEERKLQEEKKNQQEEQRLARQLAQKTQLKQRDQKEKEEKELLRRKQEEAQAQVARMRIEAQQKHLREQEQRRKEEEESRQKKEAEERKSKEEELVKKELQARQKETREAKQQEDKRATERRQKEERERIEKEQSQRRARQEKQLKQKEERQRRQKEERERRQKEQQQRKQKEQQQRKKKEESQRQDKKQKEQRQQREREERQRRQREEREQAGRKQQQKRLKEFKQSEIKLLEQQKQKEAFLDSARQDAEIKSSKVTSEGERVKKSYSSLLPTSYILMVLLGWIYYVAIR